MCSKGRGLKWRVRWLQGHVIKAACSALTADVVEGAAAAVCEQFSNGFCAPHSEGDKDCGSLARADAHQSTCKETDSSYTCASPLPVLYSQAGLF